MLDAIFFKNFMKKPLPESCVGGNFVFTSHFDGSVD